jgi:hypothetical protein
MLDNIDISNIPDDQLDAVLVSLQTLSRRTPLDYVPHPKQLMFHCANEKFRLILGGNRSGKTEAGALEAIFHATGIYPDWYPKEKRWLTQTRGRIIVTDYAKGCGENLELKLNAWLPNELIVSRRRTVKGFLEKLEIKHKSGGVSTLDVMTHEQDNDQFEGWSGHWAWFDEPPPKEQFTATMRGLMDFKGRMWFTLTPISEPWLYDEFVTRKDDNVFSITVHQDDNPYISQEEKKIFRDRLSDEDREARVEGKFRHLMGRIYKEFDESIHVVSEKFVKIDSRWPTYFVLDPADRRPHHGIWAKVDPFGTIYVVDEIVYKGTLFDLTKEIVKRELTNKIVPNEVIRILDPNKGESPAFPGGPTIKKEFATHGIHFITKVNDSLSFGHLLVKERLRYDKALPLSTSNHPKLFFIKENTVECRRQLLSYVWDNWAGRTKDAKSDKETPKDVNKDMPDCVRYLVAFGPQFFVPGEGEGDPMPPNKSTTGYH